MHGICNHHYLAPYNAVLLSISFAIPTLLHLPSGDVEYTLKKAHTVFDMDSHYVLGEHTECTSGTVYCLCAGGLL